MRNRESRIDSEAAAVDVAHQPDDAVDGVDADDGGVYVVVCGADHEITDGFEVFGREGVGVDGRRKDERGRLRRLEGESRSEKVAARLFSLKEMGRERWSMNGGLVGDYGQ